MAGSWDHILRAFQKPVGPEALPPALRKEPASTEPGKPTSTPQEETAKRSPVRKAQKGKPKAP